METLRAAWDDEREEMRVEMQTVTAGAAVMLLGTFDNEEQPLEQTVVGVIAMVVALLVGAIKYVAMYVIVHSYRQELGSLSMLFWCQIFTMAFVVPWSIADGELHNLVSVASMKTQLWVFSCLLYTSPSPRDRG